VQLTFAFLSDLVHSTSRKVGHAVLKLEFGGIGGIIGAERRQHETAIQHVPFSLGLRIHFREQLHSLSVRTCGVSLVAWTCSYQPIAFKLTRDTTLLSLSEVNLAR
jgi:hypothetical protein